MINLGGSGKNKQAPAAAVHPALLRAANCASLDCLGFVGTQGPMSTMSTEKGVGALRRESRGPGSGAESPQVSWSPLRASCAREGAHEHGGPSPASTPSFLHVI